MPDNDDYLSRQLSLVSQQFNLTNTTDQPITNQQHTCLLYTSPSPRD